MVVRQVRAWLNAAAIAALSLLVIWLGRGGLPQHADGLLWGVMAGVLLGLWQWSRLVRRIRRRDRRFARNRIFVRFISPLEVLLLAAASSHLLLLALIGVLLLMLTLGVVTGHWWTLLLGGLGLASSLVLVGQLWRFERRHGAVYYQYDSSGWGGGESLLYQRATVVEPLTPSGKVEMAGTLWQARSMRGETVARGEQVEVIDRHGLVLRVDRLDGDA